MKNWARMYSLILSICLLADPVTSLSLGSIRTRVLPTGRSLFSEQALSIRPAMIHPFQLSAIGLATQLAVHPAATPSVELDNDPYSVYAEAVKRDVLAQALIWVRVGRSASTHSRVVFALETDIDPTKVTPEAHAWRAGLKHWYHFHFNAILPPDEGSARPHVNVGPGMAFLPSKSAGQPLRVIAENILETAVERLMLVEFVRRDFPDPEDWEWIQNEARLSINTEMPKFYPEHSARVADHIKHPYRLLQGHVGQRRLNLYRVVRETSDLSVVKTYISKKSEPIIFEDGVTARPPWKTIKAFPIEGRENLQLLLELWVKIQDDVWSYAQNVEEVVRSTMDILDFADLALMRYRVSQYLASETKIFSPAHERVQTLSKALAVVDGLLIRRSPLEDANGERLQTLTMIFAGVDEAFTQWLRSEPIYDASHSLVHYFLDSAGRHAFKIEFSGSTVISIALDSFASIVRTTQAVWDCKSTFSRNEKFSVVYQRAFEDAA